MPCGLSLQILSPVSVSHRGGGSEAGNRSPAGGQRWQLEQPTRQQGEFRVEARNISGGISAGRRTPERHCGTVSLAARPQQAAERRACSGAPPADHANGRCARDDRFTAIPRCYGCCQPAPSVSTAPSLSSGSAGSSATSPEMKTVPETV